MKLCLFITNHHTVKTYLLLIKHYNIRNIGITKSLSLAVNKVQVLWSLELICNIYTLYIYTWVWGSQVGLAAYSV